MSKLMTQEEMSDMERLWSQERDEANKVRRAADGLHNATDMDSAFYRYCEITTHALALLKLIYEDISTGYWEEDNDTE